MSEEVQSRSVTRKRKCSSPIESPSKSQRKIVREEGKRRSSFVRGRKSRQLQLPTDSGFCWEISTQLNEDERLERLIKLCAQYAARKVEADIPELENISGFKVQLSDGVEKTVHTLSSQGLLKKACFKDRYLPNPVNTDVEKTAALYEDYINRLEKESSSWDLIVSTKEEEMNTAAKLVKNMDQETIDGVNLTREHTKVLTTDADFKKVLQNIRRLEGKAEMQVDTIAQMAKVLDNYKQTVTEYLNKQSANLRVKSFPVMKDLATPRQLIKNIITSKGD